MFNKYSNSVVNESFLQTVFKGLNVIIIPKKDFNSQYAIYATKYGSINNKFKFKNVSHHVPDGIAHFLEHKMFEKEDGDAFLRYAKTGASANAYTSFNNTAYLFSSTEKFDDSLDILADIVNTPYFTEKSVEKEQGIIAQEIQMGLDNPDNQCFYNLMKCLYKEHSIRNEIAGSVESISKITPELLYTCFDAFYNPSNMVLCVCGNIDENKVLEILDKRMRKTIPEQVVHIKDNEPDEVYNKRMEVSLEVSMPLFEIGIKDSFKGEGKDLVMHRITTDIIIDAIAGKSTDFYTKLYNEGLINSRFGCGGLLYSDCGAFTFSGVSSNPDKVHALLKERIEEVVKKGVDEKTFKLLKNKNYGYLLNTFNNTEELGGAYMSAFFDGISFIDNLDIYKNLSIDIVNSDLKYFDTDKMAISLVNPK